MSKLKYYVVVQGMPRLMSTTGKIPRIAVLIADNDPLIKLVNRGGDRNQIDSLLRQRVLRG